MGELPEKLFRSFGKGRIYRFINLKGQKGSFELDEGDFISKEKCPLDGANIIRIDDHVYGWDPYCPCCGGPYFSTNGSVKEDYIKKEYLPSLEGEVKATKRKLEKLEHLVNIAKDRNSSIIKDNLNNSCYNKANLSAKGDKK